MSDEKVPPTETTATLAVTAEEVGHQASWIPCRNLYWLQIKLNASKDDIDHVAGDRDPNGMNDDVKVGGYESECLGVLIGGTKGNVYTIVKTERAYHSWSN